MLNPEKSDRAYARQFIEGSALMRGVMKFCSKCVSGECHHIGSYQYSETKTVDRFTGHCWVSQGKNCHLDNLEHVINLMEESGLSHYETPLYEENPKEFYTVDVKQAEEDYFSLEWEPDKVCECGKEREYGHKYCTRCATSKRREKDRVRKAKKRGKPLVMSAF